MLSVGGFSKISDLKPERSVQDYEWPTILIFLIATVTVKLSTPTGLVKPHKLLFSAISRSKVLRNPADRKERTLRWLLVDVLPLTNSFFFCGCNNVAHLLLVCSQACQKLQIKQFAHSSEHQWLLLVGRLLLGNRANRL